MSVRDTFNVFNNYVATTSEVEALRNNPLNKVLLVDTSAKAALKMYAGSISTSEIESITPTGIKAQAKLLLSQRDVDGNTIKPNKFYTGGILLSGESAIQELEMLIKQVCVDKQEQAIVIVFSNPKEVLKKDGFLEGMDTILKSWDSFVFCTIDTQDQIREPLKKTTQLLLIKSHATEPNTTWEVGADAALAGRVVTMGVGKVDGVAKELYGITSDKLSIAEGDGGDLTTSEGEAWKELNVNLYTQTVDMRDETTGMKLLSGKEFVNAWEINKVKLDLRNDITQFRHEQERLGVSSLDEAQVRGVIANRLAILTVNQDDPELNPNGIIVASLVKPIPLDRTLEDNKTKFQFSIVVSLRGIADKFQLGITAYTDGRMTVEEV
nr:MAG TPA: hypothetical protein [Caudoviricetes sp.]